MEFEEATVNATKPSEQSATVAAKVDSTGKLEASVSYTIKFGGKK